MVSLSFSIRWFGPEEPWLYDLFWRWTQPLYWTLTLLVLVETYSHVFHRIKGFRTMGSLFFRLTSLGAGGLYLWMMFVGNVPESWNDFWNAHRWGFSVAAAVFFFLIATLARFFQTPLSTNDRLVIVAFGLMIGSSAAGSTLREIWGRGVYDVTLVVGPVVTFFTCGVGAWRFSRRGEVPDSLGKQTEVSDSQVLEYLNHISRVLGKAIDQR